MSSPEDYAGSFPEHHLDHLTGIPNLAGLESHLTDLSYEQAGEFGVLMMDIDGLKTVNDEQGHDAGDALIKDVSHIIAGSLRHNRENKDDNDIFGIVSRKGGDELIAVIHHVNDSDTLGLIGRRIANNVEAGGYAISIGGAIDQPRLSVDDVIDQADAVMYRTKLQRKIESYSPEQQATIQIIGQLAAENGINLRDIPTVLKALSELE